MTNSFTYKELAASMRLDTSVPNAEPKDFELLAFARQSGLIYTDGGNNYFTPAGIAFRADHIRATSNAGKGMYNVHNFNNDTYLRARDKMLDLREPLYNPYELERILLTSFRDGLTEYGAAIFDDALDRGLLEHVPLIGSEQIATGFSGAGNIWKMRFEQMQNNKPLKAAGYSPNTELTDAFVKLQGALNEANKAIEAIKKFL